MTVGVALTSALVLAPSGAYAAKSDCNSSKFCAFDGQNYGGSPLIESSTTSDHVTVKANKTSSAVNGTTHTWLGRDDRQAPLPDHTVFTFNDKTNYANLSGNENQIDWFDVV